MSENDSESNTDRNTTNIVNKEEHIDVKENSISDNLQLEELKNVGNSSLSFDFEGNYNFGSYDRGGLDWDHLSKGTVYSGETSDGFQKQQSSVPVATKQVPDLLTSNNSNHQINFDNIYNNFSYTPTDNLLSSTYINENTTENDLNLPIEAQTKAKFASVIEEEFEMANGLKNYATVSTENVPIQLSYNIGTENIENGKDGETLINDTQVELEENSLITEFENAGINLYDITLSNETENTHNNFSMFSNMYDSNENVKVNSPKVKIISVENIPPQATESSTVPNVDSNLQINDNSVNLNKQIYTPEALQMSLACDEELSSAWVDVVNYASNTSQANVFQENVNENPLIAVPTAIQSYLNLPPVQSNIPVSQSTDLLSDTDLLDSTTNLLGEVDNVIRKTGNTDVNLLKNLTAEANICACKDCKCDAVNNCQNCTGPEVNIYTNYNSQEDQSKDNNSCSRQNFANNSSNSKCCNNNAQDFVNIPAQTNCCSSNSNKKITSEQAMPACCNDRPSSSQNYGIISKSSGCCGGNSSNNSFETAPKSGCCGSNSTSSNQSFVGSANLISSVNQALSGNVKSGCSGSSNAMKIIKASNKNCEQKGDDCCVVVCLKTMDQLRQMLNLATGCSGFQSLNIGCVKNDFCEMPK
ncbi:hypothetical protein NQ314_016051 [Rhamnusium bicolor]|uniref:Uncharacterized protein n=1 Tax=Rhamnusium bicolor TaxID=1586634 RepID=A0AAV8WXV4_9CUCU|nr:hypothetical protein NQ314_016051 [Rhamnusium bicolor]